MTRVAGALRLVTPSPWWALAIVVAVIVVPLVAMLASGFGRAPMAQIRRVGADVVIDVRGPAQLLAFRRHFRFPLSHVRAAYVEPRVGERCRRLGSSRTLLSLMLLAGTFRSIDGRSFWLWRRGGRALTIELAGEDVDMIVVEVADPDAEAASLDPRASVAR